MLGDYPRQGAAQKSQLGALPGVDPSNSSGQAYVDAEISEKPSI